MSKERRTEQLNFRVTPTTKANLANLRNEYSDFNLTNADILAWAATYFTRPEIFLLFQCKTEDCDQRPFVISRSDLEQAGGVINCEICDKECREIKLKEKE